MLNAPSVHHWFGTDEVGRDYLARVIYGGRISLLVGVLAMLMSVCIGVTIGTVSDISGGSIDAILMRIVDVMQSIPWLVLVTVISIFFKQGLSSIIIVIGFFSWMEISRLVRAEIMSIKEREYILYAEFFRSIPVSDHHPASDSGSSSYDHHCCHNKHCKRYYDRVFPEFPGNWHSGAYVFLGKTSPECSE